MIDCFEEMDAVFAIVTETWLSDGGGLVEDLENLEAGAGLGMLALNRLRNHRGVSYGGVAVISSLSKCAFKMVKLSNCLLYTSPSPRDS